MSLCLPSAAESCHVTDTKLCVWRQSMGLRSWTQAPSRVQDLNHWHSDAKSQHIIYTSKFSLLPATTYRCRTIEQGRRGGTGRGMCVCTYLEAAITVWKDADWQRSVDGGFCCRGKRKVLALKLGWDLHTPKAEIVHCHKTPLNPLCSHGFMICKGLKEQTQTLLSYLLWLSIFFFRNVFKLCSIWNSKNVFII